jgi:biotin operon repressor
MLYQRSLDIETRLTTALRLIQAGQYSTPALARELGVSIPTVSRCVTALRERGFDIRAERQGNVWHYVLATNAAGNSQRNATSARKRAR